MYPITHSSIHFSTYTSIHLCTNINIKSFILSLILPMKPSFNQHPTSFIHPSLCPFPHLFIHTVRVQVRTRGAAGSGWSVEQRRGSGGATEAEHGSEAECGASCNWTSPAGCEESPMRGTWTRSARADLDRADRKKKGEEKDLATVWHLHYGRISPLINTFN